MVVGTSITAWRLSRQVLERRPDGYLCFAKGHIATNQAIPWAERVHTRFTSVGRLLWSGVSS